MIHPFLSNQSDHEIIPNDLILGGDQTPRGLILTGPNMGGKSTLLRSLFLFILFLLFLLLIILLILKINYNLFK